MHHRLIIIPLQDLPVEVVRRAVRAIVLQHKAFLQVYLCIASRVGVGEASSPMVAGEMIRDVRVTAVSRGDVNGDWERGGFFCFFVRGFFNGGHEPSSSRWSRGREDVV